MRSLRRVLVLSATLGVVLAALTAGIVLAQDQALNGKLLTGSDVTLAQGQSVDHDLYVFAGNVTSNATINGDLTVTGGRVDVNGSVTGDVLAAGGTITINGTVGGNVRAAGGTITVNGKVTKDVAMAGGTLAIGQGGAVGGDLIVSGGNLSVDGTVAGSAAGGVGTYSKHGSIAGTDSITAGGSGGSTAQPFVNPSNPVLDAIRQFVTVVVLGLLLFWLWPRRFDAAEGEVRTRPLPALGWGVLACIGFVGALIVISIAAFVLALILAFLGFYGLIGLDLLGTIVALLGLTFAFILASAFLADAVVGLAIARLVTGRGFGGRDRVPAGVTLPPGGLGTDDGRRTHWNEIGLFIVGVAVVVILTSLPAIGGLLKLLVVLLGLGAIVWALWRAPNEPRVATAPATPGSTGGMTPA